MTALDCPVCTAPGVTDERCPRCAAELTELRLLALLKKAEPAPAPADVAAPVSEPPIKPRGVAPGTAIALSALTGLLGLVLGRSMPHGVDSAVSESPRATTASSPGPLANAGPGPVARPSPGPTGRRVHVVRPGESPWSIARQVFGHGRCYPNLILPPGRKVLQPGDHVLVEPRPCP